MKKIKMTDIEQIQFRSIFNNIKDWTNKHQTAIGITEIALGSALVAYSINNGLVEMGKDLFFTSESNSQMNNYIAGLTGTTFGNIGAFILGNIGVAAAGTAIGIPVIGFMALSGIAIGAISYTASDLIQSIFGSQLNFNELLLNSSLFTLGIALIIDGARRSVSTETLNQIETKIQDGVIYITNTLKDNASAIGVTTLSAGIGGVVGSGIATSSVTVLGSNTIGSLALSMGLVSAPILPIAIGVLAIGSLGFSSYKIFEYYTHEEKKLLPILDK